MATQDQESNQIRDLVRQKYGEAARIAMKGKAEAAVLPEAAVRASFGGSPERQVPQGSYRGDPTSG
jgi:hypothetical protein